ncbi:ankyrin repeat-containing domain protein [Mycena floridula]|nr:ankyrin repeat-containing domain protein [Mycena floridula]
MIHAASHGSLSLLKQFVKWGSDLNAQDMTDLFRSTALSGAAKHGQLETVKFLLEHRVDANARAGSRGSALAAAAAYGKIEVVEYLLNHGADPNAHVDILQAAVYRGLEGVKLLIDKGANLQVQGEAALRKASGRGDLEIIKLLIEKGVSPKNANILWLACYSGHLEVVKFLVENGADVNAQDGHHGTPLQAAIWSRKSGVVEFLIESGADVNASTGKFGTLLQLAIQKGPKEIEDILRRQCARE